MGETAGNVDVKITGDASGLSRAVQDTIAAVDKAKGKFTELTGALNNTAVTSKLSTDQLAALRKQAEQAAVDVRKLTGASNEATTATQALATTSSGGLKQTKEVVEKVRGTMGALGQAIGSASQAFGALGGVAQGALSAFMQGGPLAVGLAVVVAGVSAFVAEWGKTDEAVRAAATAAMKATKSMVDTFRQGVLDMKTEIAGLNLQAAMAGLPESAKRFAVGIHDAASAMQKLREFEKQFGLRESPLAINPVSGAIEPRGMDESAGPMTAGFIQASAGGDRAAAEKMLVELDKAYRLLQEQWALRIEIAKAAERAAKADENAAAAAKKVVDLTGEIAESAQQGATSIEGWTPFSKWAKGEPAAPSGMSVAAPAVTSQLIATTQEGARAIGVSTRSFVESAREAGLGLLDLVPSTERLGIAFDLAKKDLAEAFSGVNLANILEAVAQGKGGEAAGTQVGGIVGAAIGMGTGIDPTGAASGAIGALIGGILGKALDSVVEALGVLTPIFDGVAIVVQALTPILQVVAEVAKIVGTVLTQLAPLILVLARPIASLVLVAVRLVEALMPFVYIVINAVTALVMFIDLLTMGIGWLDDNFFRPLATAAAFIFNGFVDLINGLILMIRQIPGMEEFGVLLEHMDSFYSDLTSEFAGSLDELNKSVEDVDDPVAEGVEEGMNNFSREAVNLPGGYKTTGVEFAAAAPTSPMTIIIERLIASGAIPDELVRLGRMARSGSIVDRLSSHALGDDKG